MTEQTLLARVDERTEHIERELKSICKRLDALPNEYVTQCEFRPVRALVYGGVGLFLTSVLSGVVALCVQRILPF